jgi:hypothetical protein
MRASADDGCDMGSTLDSICLAVIGSCDEEAVLI